MNFLGVPIKTAPRWKFWIAKLFGKTIHRHNGMLFKSWRGGIWVMKVVKEGE